MALPTYTLATATKNADGTYTLGNRPTGAYALATVDAAAAKVPAPIANFGGGTGPATNLDETVSLNVLQTRPTTSEVVANKQYNCSSDLWNNGDGGTAWVLGLDPTSYWSIGMGLVNGVKTFVTIDVANATYVPFAAGAAGTPRDIYDVPTLKRKEVVDANVPAYAETDSSYYGKVFVDEVYGPGQPAKYECLPSAPATTGGATVWKWFRIDIL